MTDSKQSGERDSDFRTKVSPNGSPFSKPLPDIGLDTIDENKWTNGSPVLKTIPSQECGDDRTKRTTDLDSKKLKIDLFAPQEIPEVPEDEF